MLLKRPKYLSNDKASLMDVIKHVIKKIGFKENVILLQPTSPLRTDNDVIKGIKMLQRGVDAVMSQCKLQYNSAKIKRIATFLTSPPSKPWPLTSDELQKKAQDILNIKKLSNNNLSESLRQ